jgi:uncharacterized membrane protein YphA (DoxX/SURF4 family)
MGWRLLHWLCRAFLAALFVYSGWVKLGASLQFAATLYEYRIVPTSLILTVATYLPWMEIALGLLITSGLVMRPVAVFAAALLVLFIAVQAVTYLRGIEADCGCFGSGERISPWTIGRDFLFLLPALYLAGERRITRLRRAA